MRLEDGLILLLSGMDGYLAEQLGERLDGLLSSAESILGLTVVVHDHAGLLLHVPMKDRHFHRNPFCQAGRDEQPSFERRCQEHCRYGMPAALAQDGQPMVHSCWKGGAEACVAVHRAGIHALTLFAGVRRAAPTPPADLEPLAVRAWRALPSSDPEGLLKVGRVLKALGQSILAEVDAALAAGTGSRQAVVEACLEAGLASAVGLEEVARRLDVSPSRAAHLVTELFGRPFGELLQERRLSRASHLLATTDLSVAAVAARCGFTGQHWFSRIFTRQFGLPPGRWRIANRAGA